MSNDSDMIPEGLHAVVSGKALEIRDAQDYVWVTLAPAAPGDPVTWEDEITGRVLSALGLDPADTIIEA